MARFLSYPKTRSLCRGPTQAVEGQAAAGGPHPAPGTAVCGYPGLLGKDNVATPRSLGLHSQNLASRESQHSRVWKLRTGKTKHLWVWVEHWPREGEAPSQ